MRIRDEDIIGLRPLKNIDTENALYHAPPLDEQLREIMQDLGPRKPFVNGEAIGAVWNQGDKRPPNPVPTVQRALHYETFVNRTNSDIKDLRRSRLGIATDRPYLTLDVDCATLVKRYREDR